MPKRNHVSQQTHINREPLGACIIQAMRPRKRQNALSDGGFQQKQSQKPIEKSTQEPVEEPIDRIGEGQAIKMPDPLPALPGFFMDSMPPGSIGGHKYPAGCVIFRVAFKHKGRRFSKTIGRNDDGISLFEIDLDDPAGLPVGIPAPDVI